MPPLRSEPDDPKQAIAAAVVLSRICGALCLVTAVFASLPLAFALLVRGTPLMQVHLLYVTAVAVVAVVPGALHLVLPIYVQRRQAWAVGAGIAVATFHAACAVAGIVLLAEFAAQRTRAWYVAAPVAGALAIVVVCGTLAYSLLRARRAFDAPEVGGPRGFEPVRPRDARPPTGPDERR